MAVCHTSTRSRILSKRHFNPTSILSSLSPLTSNGMLKSTGCNEFQHLYATEAFDKVYNLSEDLGRGKFSTVKKCIKKDDKDKAYAAKFIKKRYVKHALNELRILELSQKHPCLITLHEVYDLPLEAIFILEYAQQGDLQFVLELEGCLDESKASHVTKQLLEAVEFLHNNKIVHLDIKPQNILLMEKWPSTTIKLCDFGLSRILTNECIHEILGTTDFLAPEVVSYEPLTRATDMWSIGVLIYVLVTGHTPFGGTNKHDTHNNITHCILDFPVELFDSISMDCIDLIKKLIVRIPKQRALANECLQHIWLTRLPTINGVCNENEQRPSKGGLSDNQTDSGFESPITNSLDRSFDKIIAHSIEKNTNKKNGDNDFGSPIIDIIESIKHLHIIQSIPISYEDDEDSITVRQPSKDNYVFPLTPPYSGISLLSSSSPLTPSLSSDIHILDDNVCENLS
ncbi:unnamed protein product [Didymodactylos carnosus]|uniref:Protein kinase domain-containing protein n=1 Tax=Didymodactylos carnosus TaxID=1234261 RepID=A0A8S2DN41_9BILA|nr:unnamed protein product [Didymodactylos carnosus]CAF3776659.1 unnamed protein product [Didymodactylos carnosus]